MANPRGMTTGAPPHVPNPHDTVDDKSAMAIRQRSDHLATAGPAAPATGAGPSLS